MTDVEPRGYGLIRKRPDRRDYRFSPPATWTGTFVDIADQFPEAPFDQGPLGSCVAQSGAACADFALVRQGGTPLKRPSRLFLYYQGRVRGGYPVRQDTGLQIRDVFEVLNKDGGPPERLWEYRIERFAEKPPGSVYAEASEHQALAYGAVAASDIDATIASGYPVCFGFDVYQSFESAACTRDGVMPIPDRRREALLGGHAMVFVSTPVDGSEIPNGVPGVAYRKARNSWGTAIHGPGEGHVWFPVSEAEIAASDFWVVTTMEDPAVPQPPVPADVALPPELSRALEAADESSAVRRFLRSAHRGDVRKAADHLREILAAPRS